MICFPAVLYKVKKPCNLIYILSKVDITLKRIKVELRELNGMEIIPGKFHFSRENDPFKTSNRRLCNTVCRHVLSSASFLLFFLINAVRAPHLRHPSFLYKLVHCYGGYSFLFVSPSASVNWVFELLFVYKKTVDLAPFHFVSCKRFQEIWYTKRYYFVQCCVNNNKIFNEIIL